ncbi:MAG TPA: hypothetical protein DCQ04_16360 [Actinobacteria bacterium]|nr:hypothetical protein [Actinomycetota bacterium]
MGVSGQLELPAPTLQRRWRVDRTPAHSDSVGFHAQRVAEAVIGLYHSLRGGPHLAINGREPPAAWKGTQQQPDRRSTWATTPYSTHQG